MKLSDLKIRAQLALGFLLILLLLISLSILSSQQRSELAQQTEDMYNHPLKVRRAVGDIRGNIINISRHFKDFYLAKKSDISTKAIQEIELAKENIASNIEILYDRYLGPMKDINRLQTEFTNYSTVLDEAISQFRNEQFNFSDYTNNHFEIRQEMKVIEALQVIDKYAENKSDQLYEDSLIAEKRLYITNLIFLILILIISFTVSAVITRNIGIPISRITAITKEFRDGKLQARTNYISKNELGVLAQSFNEMADTIEGIIDTNKKSEKISNVMLQEDDAHRFCNKLIFELINQTKSQAGAIYFIDNNEKQFELFESIGFDENIKRTFLVSQKEGELGLSYSSGKIQRITNIPEDSRFVYESVAGSIKPREIITIPINDGRRIIGMISIITVKKFSESALSLIEVIMPTLNARVNGILAYRKVIEFSKQLEQQYEVLKKQERELAVQSSELSEQNTELEMQAKQLDEANKLKTTFLSNMSHELRTPLNSVIALSGVLNRRLKGKINDEEFGYISVIERNGKHLLSLINDILDISRIETGKEELSYSRFSVNYLVSEIISLVEPLAMQKGIDLIYEENESMPIISSDYRKCMHILQNLVGNAVKFTEVGKVEIYARLEEDLLTVGVKDTGIGINKEELPYVFDEFRQVDNSNSRMYEGTGLGLSIVRKYVEMLGGTIKVKSKLNQGSEFVFAIPVQIDNSDEIDFSDENKKEANELKSKATKSKKPSILVVEDSEPAMIQITEILEPNGFKVIKATNGKKALKAISKNIPDIVLLDLMMPEVDGFEVLIQMRSKRETRKVPVIILTAKMISEKELDVLKQNHIKQLIQKGSINKNDLLLAINEILTAKDSKKKIKLKQRVLIVEDNPDNMLTMKALLKDIAEIIEAEDGYTGVTNAIDFMPNLILMDIALPGITGIEALQKIRENNKTKNIPVVAVTASALDSERDEIISHGFDGYISKPIDNEIFLDVIGRYVKLIL